MLLCSVSCLWCVVQGSQVRQGRMHHASSFPESTRCSDAILTGRWCDEQIPSHRLSYNAGLSHCSLFSCSLESHNARQQASSPMPIRTMHPLLPDFSRQKSYTIHPEFGHSYGSQLTDYNYAALPYHFKLQHHVYPLTIIPSAIPPVDP